MKREVIKLLKEKNKFNLFTEERYKLVKNFMSIISNKDIPLKTYLSFDPLNKAQFIADHFVKNYE